LDALLGWLPLIACAAIMLVVCIPMMKGKHKRDDGDMDSETQQQIAELREEIARLRAERSISSKQNTNRG
jgi:hypothetical protein